jgi:hypothetical protein
MSRILRLSVGELVVSDLQEMERMRSGIMDALWIRWLLPVVGVYQVKTTSADSYRTSKRRQTRHNRQQSGLYLGFLTQVPLLCFPFIDIDQTAMALHPNHRSPSLSTFRRRS